jgi:scyllo-inositol 2-dehydrogenase (NADP+)
MRNQAEELFNMAEKKGLLLTVSKTAALMAIFSTVKKVLEQGNDWGGWWNLNRITTDTETLLMSDSWKEHGGDYSGVLYNLGSHMVDQVVVLFGRPKAVTAHLKIVRSGGNVNDYYDIRLEYESFAAILKMFVPGKEPGPRYSLHGDTGTFHKWVSIHRKS